MAFNGYFPTGYQPVYYPQQMQTQALQSTTQQNPAPQNSGIIWVQGEAGAKSYLVAPNSTVTLWDTESQTIYIKSADASGMPSMKVVEYTVRGGTQEVQQNNFATKDDLESLREEINELRTKLKGGSK